MIIFHNITKVRREGNDSVTTPKYTSKVLKPFRLKKKNVYYERSGFHEAKIIRGKTIVKRYPIRKVTFIATKEVFINNSGN